VVRPLRRQIPNHRRTKRRASAIPPTARRGSAAAGPATVAGAVAAATAVVLLLLLLRLVVGRLLLLLRVLAVGLARRGWRRLVAPDHGAHPAALAHYDGGRASGRRLGGRLRRQLRG